MCTSTERADELVHLSSVFQHKTTAPYQTDIIITNSMHDFAIE